MYTISVLYNIIKELFSAIKEVQTNKKIKLINNIYISLKLSKQNDIKTMFSYSVSIINLVNSLLENDLVKYNKNIFDLLNPLTGEDNKAVNFKKGTQKQINKFMNPILHRIINLILEKIKNQLHLKKVNQISNIIENIKDPKVRNFFSQLRIEKINIDEPSDKLDKMRLYLAQMNLRLFMYDDMKANFRLEYRGEIIEMIKENLKKSKAYNANIIIFPEYSFPEEIIPVLIEYSKKNNIWIIGGLERFESIQFNLSLKENATIIISPNSAPILQKKHFRGKSEPELIPDDKIKIITSKFGTFCVLICADFLEDYLNLIIRDQIDFIVVPSFNHDVESFEYSAFNKCFTVMCYIIICNIQKYNESKIFAPFRQNRVLEMDNSYFIELNFTEFSLHRKRRPISSLYKKPLSDTLYEMEFKSY